MPIDHMKIVRHISKQLDTYGFISFAEINKVADTRITRLKPGTRSRTETSKFLHELLGNPDYVIRDVPRSGHFRGQSGNIRPPRGEYFIMEKDIEPIVAYARQSPRKSRWPRYHPVVNTLLKIDEQTWKGNHVLLPHVHSDKPIKPLIELKLLKEAKYAHGKRPKAIRAVIHRFRVTNPELMRKAIRAAKKIVGIEEEHAARE